MSNLFEARVQGGRDYISGVGRADPALIYDADELRQWEIGWDTEQQLHSLSAAKKESGENWEKVKEIVIKLEKCIERDKEEYELLQGLLDSVSHSLGVLLEYPPFLKKNVLKRVRAICENIKKFTDIEDKKVSAVLPETEEVDIPTVYEDVSDSDIIVEDPEVGC